MLTDALTAGVPVVCTDNCGYSIFLHKTCCPVIPAPYHLAAITDAISFAIVHCHRCDDEPFLVFFPACINSPGGVTL